MNETLPSLRRRLVPANFERVGRELLGLELDTKALQGALPPLRNTNRSKLPGTEIAEIEATLARLREQDGTRRISK